MFLLRLPVLMRSCILYGRHHHRHTVCKLATLSQKPFTSSSPQSSKAMDIINNEQIKPYLCSQSSSLASVAQRLLMYTKLDLKNFFGLFLSTAEKWTDHDGYFINYITSVSLSSPGIL